MNLEQKTASILAGAEDIITMEDLEDHFRVSLVALAVMRVQQNGLKPDIVNVSDYMEQEQSAETDKNMLEVAGNRSFINDLALSAVV